MNQVLVNSPADILRQLVCQASFAQFTQPDYNMAWPLYVAELPDGTDVPDNAGCIYDTPGQVQHRLLASGRNLQEHGLQLFVRSLDYTAGFALAQATGRFCSQVRRQDVVLAGKAYRIDTINQASTVISLGQDAKRRSQFTLNLLIMLLY